MAEVLPFPTLPFDSPLDSQPEPALAGPPEPPDAEARREALDIHRSFIVEAPAGSGKTALLIHRFLKLLADPAVSEPEQVLAITFTKKATAEMRDRVLAGLEAARDDDAAAHASSDFNRQAFALALAVLERSRQLGWSLLEQPHRLNIRTIDSVCAEIARTLPILSGGGGRLTPTEDAQTLHREAARRTLLLLGGGDPVFDDSLRNLLLHRDGNLADCETLIADMLALRDQWGDLIWGELIPIAQRRSLDNAFLDANVLPRLQRALALALGEQLARLEQTFPPLMLAELSILAAEFADDAEQAGESSRIAACAGRSEPPEATASDLDHWLALICMVLTATTGGWRQRFTARDFGVALDSGRKARLSALVDQLRDRDDLREAMLRVKELPPAQYPAEQWSVAKSLFRVLSRALVELQLVFAERSQCDFTELSLLARNALTQESGPEYLASQLGARLQHLLVDEMQDTSTSQYHLLQLLTASWDGHSQTVFLVGDPRQSIYLFRQARVEHFIRAVLTGQLGDLPLTHLRLTTNFRSQRSLVDQFNRDFSCIFPRSSPPEALPYRDAASVLPPSDYASGGNWHADPVERPDATDTQPAAIPIAAQRKGQQRRRHAEEILRIAGDWLVKPLPAGRRTIRDEAGKEIPEPWRIAVLVRSRNHLAEIVTALGQLGPQASIPFRATQIEVLRERQEVLDLAALTRALLHPADRVAALAVLRAPWCGLSLADLHLLTGADDSSLRDRSIPRLIADRSHLLAEDSRLRVARVAQVLSSAAGQRARLTTAQLVERAWRTLGGDAWLGPAELLNARHFFQLLDSLEAELGGPARIDAAQLDDRLQTLFAEPQAISRGTACIDLLTIHKAKGLEWDVVFVPALERKPATDRARLLTWSVIESPDSPGASDRGAAHIMLAPIAAKGEDRDPLTRWLNRLRRDRQAAEDKRLFYVACTRARQELHLFAAPATKADGEISVAPTSLLHAAWPAAEPHFAPDLSAPSELDLAASAAPASVSDKYHGISAIRSISNPLDDAVASPLGPALQRLPPAFDPAARFAGARTLKLPYGDPGGDPDSGDALFSRPEGSFAARSFGTAVHASLELLARRIAGGETSAGLLADLPAWTPRIAALLRADGLPRETVVRLAREVRTALDVVLRDPDGLWLLAPHLGAASEFALTAWRQDGDMVGPGALRPTSVRADRIFHAGSEPGLPGEEFLWIVDYKTSARGPGSLQDFLATQRAAYAPQLEAYARILAPAQSKSLSQIRLALYFPTLPGLTWWQPGPLATPTTDNS